MLVLSNDGGVWLRSDETDVINNLREAERLQQRWERMEEIRAKWRAARESEEEEDGQEEERDANSDGGEEQTEENKKSELLTVAGEVASAIGAGCKNASGVFKQLNKAGKPIYKHISGGKMGMRQINKIGKRAIFKPTNSVASSLASGVGKACLVAAVVLDAIEIGVAIKEDVEGGTKHHTVHASAGVAGSWAGAVPGAMLGASIGSIVPVAGSIIGGIIGGVIGSLGGGFLARKIAEEVLPAPEEKQLAIEDTKEEEAIDEGTCDQAVVEAVAVMDGEAEADAGEETEGRLAIFPC